MYTIQARAFRGGNTVSGFYGTFDDQAAAERAAVRVRFFVQRDHGICDTNYTAVQLPDGVTPEPLDPGYVG